MNSYIDVTKEIETYEHLEKGRYELLDSEVILDKCMEDAMMGGDSFNRIQDAVRKKQIHENLKLHATMVTGKIQQIEDDKKLEEMQKAQKLKN